MPLFKGINYFIKDTVEFIDVEGASCLGNWGVKNIIEDIVEFIDLNAWVIEEYLYTRYCGIY